MFVHRPRPGPFRLLSGSRLSLFPRKPGSDHGFPTLRDGDTMKALAAALALAIGLVWTVFSAHPSEASGHAGVSSIGDASMGPLMDAWLAGLQRTRPGVHRGERWEHRTEAAAIGALMFEIADMAPL